MHSRGPWKHNGLGCIHAKNENGDMDIVAGILSEDPDSVYARNEEEAMANVRLIAIAPEMYYMICELMAEAVTGHVYDRTVRKAQTLLLRVEKGD